MIIIIDIIDMSNANWTLIPNSNKRRILADIRPSLYGASQGTYTANTMHKSGANTARKQVFF